MACRVAENPALERLRVDLALERFCHSQRIDCIHRLPRASEPSYYGISGAFMGFCQALFNQQGSHAENTRRIATVLTEAGLPWARSHELFIGHRRDEPIQHFVQEAARPLSEFGRVPILITGIDVADNKAVDEIFSSPIDVVSGETVLVRLVADSPTSIHAAGTLIERLVQDSERTQQMPRWWPLFQASTNADDWRKLRTDLGSLWKYVNIGTNPFTHEATWDAVQDQMMVAQFVVPGLNDITDDGAVRVSDGMKIYGAAAGDSYNISALTEKISRLDSWPTCIFLGPTLPHWTEEENLQRVRKTVSFFIESSKRIWDENGLARYEPLWEMAA